MTFFRKIGAMALAALIAATSALPSFAEEYVKVGEIEYAKKHWFEEGYLDLIDRDGFYFYGLDNPKGLSLNSATNATSVDTSLAHNRNPYVFQGNNFKNAWQDPQTGQVFDLGKSNVESSAHSPYQKSNGDWIGGEWRFWGFALDNPENEYSNPYLPNDNISVTPPQSRDWQKTPWNYTDGPLRCAVKGKANGDPAKYSLIFGSFLAAHPEWSAAGWTAASMDERFVILQAPQVDSATGKMTVGGVFRGWYGGGRYQTFVVPATHPANMKMMPIQAYRQDNPTTPVNTSPGWVMNADPRINHNIRFTVKNEGATDIKDPAIDVYITYTSDKINQIGYYDEMFTLEHAGATLASEQSEIFEYLLTSDYLKQHMTGDKIKIEAKIAEKHYTNNENLDRSDDYANLAMVFDPGLVALWRNLNLVAGGK